MEKAWAIGGLVIAAAIILVSVDLLMDGKLGQLLGKPLAGLAAAPAPEEPSE